MYFLKKQKKSIDYLLMSILFGGLSIYWILSHLTNFAYLINGYPDLEDASLVQGKVNVKYSYFNYRGSRKAEVIGKGFKRENFLIDSKGNQYELHYLFHENYKGRGHRIYRFYNEIYDGTRAKIWMHPYIGVIKAEYILSDTQLAQLKESFPENEFEKSFQDSFAYIKQQNLKYFNSFDNRKIYLILIVFLQVSVFGYYKYRTS